MEYQPGKDVFSRHLWGTRGHFVPVFGYKHTKGMLFTESLPEIARFLSPSVASGRFVFPHIIAPCGFALDVASFCGFIAAFRLFNKKHPASGASHAAYAFWRLPECASPD